MIDETRDLAIASAGTYSASFYVPYWALFVGLGLPAMDDGVIGLEGSWDGTNYHPLLDVSDGQDLVICASGSDPGIIDITDFVRFVPQTLALRLTCSAQSSGAVTVKLFLRGG